MWSFTDVTGATKNVSNGFYPATESESSYQSNHYALDFGNEDEQYRFRVNISGVHVIHAVQISQTQNMLQQCFIPA